MNLSDLHDKNKTDARLELLRLGYTPIKLDGKIPSYAGWDTGKVTEELIRSKDWNRDGKRVNTGIRCVGTEIIGLDIDIADEQLVNDFFDACVEAGFIRPADEIPVRIGRAPRELWVFRTGGKPMVPRRSASFAANAVDYEVACQMRDEVLAQVTKRNAKEKMAEASRVYAEFEIETYAIETPRQFAAFGTHPGTGEPFEWPDGDLPPVGELPILDNLQGVIGLFETFMFERGFVRTSSGVATGNFQHVDGLLTGSSVLVTEEWGALTCDEAIERFEPGFSCRCAPSAVRKISVATGNGQLRILRDGTGLQLTDYPAAKVYEYRQTIDQVAATLGALMARKFPEHMALAEASIEDRQRQGEEREQAPPVTEIVPGMLEDPDDADLWAANVEAALNRWVLIAGESVYDTLTGTEMKVRAHREAYAQCRYSKPAPTQAQVKRIEAGDLTEDDPEVKRKSIELFDVWRVQAAKLQASGVTGHPARPKPFYQHKGQTLLNNWTPADLPTTGGDAQPFLGLIDWLLPIEDERRDFKNWLADMFQNRGIRRYGVLMIAEEYGTGRDTLHDIIGRMLGTHNARAVAADDLTSNGGQTQYNDWLVGYELYTIDEVCPEGASQLQLKKTYTNIKQYMDPRDKSIRINRKNLANFEAVVYGTFLMASNHDDAMALGKGDRRVAVYRNPDTRMDAEQGRYLNEDWKHDPANIGAALRYFQNYAIDTGWSRVHPPETETKQEMHESNRHPAELAVLKVLDLMRSKGAVMCSVQAVQDIVEAHYNHLRQGAGSASVDKIWGSYWYPKIKDTFRAETIRMNIPKGGQPYSYVNQNRVSPRLLTFVSTQNIQIAEVDKKVFHEVRGAMTGADKTAKLKLVE